MQNETSEEMTISKAPESEKRERLSYYRHVIREPGVYLPDFDPTPDEGWIDGLDLAVEVYRDKWPQEGEGEIRARIERELLENARHRRLIAEEIGKASRREEGLVRIDLRRIVLPEHEDWSWVGSLVKPLQGRSVVLALAPEWSRSGGRTWDYLVSSGGE